MEAETKKKLRKFFERHWKQITLLAILLIPIDAVRKALLMLWIIFVFTDSFVKRIEKGGKDGDK